MYQNNRGGREYHNGRGGGRGRGRGGGGNRQRGGGGGYNWRKHVKQYPPGTDRHEAKRMEALNDLANLGINPDLLQPQPSADRKDAGATDVDMVDDQKAVDMDPEEVVLEDGLIVRLQRSAGDVLHADGTQNGSMRKKLRPTTMEEHAEVEKDVDALIRSQAAPDAKLQEFRRGLPAFSKRQEIIETVRNHRVVVISGATGCGKTTQVPQFILDDAWGSSAHCNIVCTQPRRISAMGVADRVANERGEDIDKQTGIVGYQHRLEQRKGENTRLLFCTTGILLRRLHMDPELKGVTHIVLDEVHERSIDSDFLIVLLRDLLASRPDLKVVLMSATLNAEIFAQYFENALQIQVPILHIPGRSYDVEPFFLEDAVEMTGRFDSIQTDINSLNKSNNNNNNRRGGGRGNNQQGNNSKSKLTAEMRETVESTFRGNNSYSSDTNRAMMGFDASEIPNTLIKGILEHIDAKFPMNDEPGGAVLVFLPGWEDIKKLNEELDSSMNRRSWEIFTLHGNLGPASQRAVFAPPPKGKRKIVLSTNIAESSITIDDISFVIDSCMHKEKTYDEHANISCLLTDWVSRASAMQRRGRAGRVRDGKCWHLIPRCVYDNHLKEYALPEIVRTPLEPLCLQIRALEVAQNNHPGGIIEFLEKALTTPSLKTAENAIDLLKRIGALDENESLTLLGESLCQLPMGPQIGKSLIMAAILGCLDPVVTLTAILSDRPIFIMPSLEEDRGRADRAKQRLANGHPSDHFAMLNAFYMWEQSRNQRRFASENFLNFQQLVMVKKIKQQYMEILCDAHVIPRNRQEWKWFDRHGNNWPAVKACMVAGLYPNIARIDARRRKTSFFIKGLGKTSAFPASVNAEANSYSWNHRWAMYHDKVKSTGGIYLYDTSQIGPFPLILFGEASIHNDENGLEYAELSDIHNVNYDDLPEAQQHLLNVINEVMKQKDGDVTYAWLARTMKGVCPNAFFDQNQKLKLKPFLGKHGFQVSKKNGRFVVNYAPRAKKYLSLQDWVYFPCEDERIAQLIFSCRQAVDVLIKTRMHGKSPSDLQNRFVDTLCETLKFDDDFSHEQRKYERVKRQGNYNDDDDDDDDDEDGGSRNSTHPRRQHHQQRQQNYGNPHQQRYGGGGRGGRSSHKDNSAW